MKLISYLAPAFPRSLFELVGELVGAEVLYDETRSGPVPDDDPFANGEVDLGWICSTSYVGLSLSSSRPTVQLTGVAWVPDDPGSDGKAQYFGDLVVPSDSAVESLADLAGKRIGCNDSVSLSGHYALRFELERQGLDPDTFAELIFTGGHERSLEMIADGDLDAATVDSVVRTVRSRTNPRVAGLRVIDRLGPWPVQPLVMHADASPEMVADVRARLLDAADDPRLVAELTKAGLAGLTEVGSDHYEPVHQAMAKLG